MNSDSSKPAVTALHPTDSISYGKKKSSHFTISYWKKNHPIHPPLSHTEKKITPFIPHYLIHYLIHSLTITIVCIVVECYQALAIGSGKRKEEKLPILNILKNIYLWTIHVKHAHFCMNWRGPAEEVRKSSETRWVVLYTIAMQGQFANSSLLVFSLPQICSRSHMQASYT